MRRPYPALPTSKDTENNDLIILMLLTLLIYKSCQSQSQGKINEVFMYFLSGGKTEWPISINLHFQKWGLPFNKF